MARISPFEVEGFDRLNERLKELPDKIKRREVLKIFKRLAKPVIKVYAEELPVGKRDKKRFGNTYIKGTLSKSIKAVTVPKSKSGGNPAIAIRPAKKGKYDPWYRFMVVKKGTNVGSGKKGSRKGKNTVVDDARDESFDKVGAQARQKALEQTSKYIDKQIKKLDLK